MHQFHCDIRQISGPERFFPLGIHLAVSPGSKYSQDYQEIIQNFLHGKVVWLLFSAMCQQNEYKHTVQQLQGLQFSLFIQHFAHTSVEWNPNFYTTGKFHPLNKTLLPPSLFVGHQPQHYTLPRVISILSHHNSIRSIGIPLICTKPHGFLSVCTGNVGLRHDFGVRDL